MPPFGLRSNWPGASLLTRSSIAGDTLPPSRLAPGQFERNECIVISETPHQHSIALGRWFLSILRTQPGRNNIFMDSYTGAVRGKSRALSVVSQKSETPHYARIP